MLFSRLRQAATLTKSISLDTQRESTTLDSSQSTMKELTKSLTSTTRFPTNKTSLSPQPGQATSETISTSKPPSTIGLIKTESTMSTKPIFDAPKFTCSALFGMPL